MAKEAEEKKQFSRSLEEGGDDEEEGLGQLRRRRSTVSLDEADVIWL